MFDFFKRPQCHFKSHNLTGSHNCTFLTVVVKCKVRFCFRLIFHFFYDLWPIKDRINGKFVNLSVVTYGVKVPNERMSNSSHSKLSIPFTNSPRVFSVRLRISASVFLKYN